MINIGAFIDSLRAKKFVRSPRIKFFGWYNSDLKGTYVLSEVPKYFKDLNAISIHSCSNGDISIRVAFDVRAF